MGGSFKVRARAVGVSQAVESLGAPIASQLGARALLPAYMCCVINMLRENKGLR